MTESEAQKWLEVISNWESIIPNVREASKIGINALEENQRYKAIGTVEEFNHDHHMVHIAENVVDSVEREKAAIRDKAIEDFANYLHKIAERNNGLRLSGETRSWTHACVYDYVKWFKEQAGKEE